MSSLRMITFVACSLLIGCKGRFGSQDTLHPISSTPLPGAGDFDMNTYTVGNEQLSDQLYFFAFDKSQVSAEDKESLERIALIIRKHPNIHVRIEGHTDDLGSAEYNVGLGLRRAQAVSEVLESQGVEAQQIETISYGKENPLIVATDDYARSKNRRAFVSFAGGN